MKTLSLAFMIVALVCLPNANSFTLEDLDLKQVTNELEKINLNLEDVDMSIFHE